MFPRNVTALRVDALFVSALQRSDQLSRAQIRQALAVAVDRYGVVGCAGRVAQEFGDHSMRLPSGCAGCATSLTAAD